MKKVKFLTLGCKVNLYETEAMKGLFENSGYEVTESEDADVFVINTCTVTAMSDRKSRQMIRRAKKKNPKSIVAVLGCYSQVAPEEVAKIEDIDIIMGTTDRTKIVEYVEAFDGTRQNRVQAEIPKVFEDLKSTHQNRTRATLKIQDGCRNFCTYCIIPFARGPLRSKTTESTIAEVKELAHNGYKEIVLVGINLAMYGVDTNSSLIEIIEAVCGVEGIERVRLGSLEPNLITDDFIERTKKLPNFCHHFHLALQSGSTTVLERMKRHYTAEEYIKAAEMLKNAFPDCALTTDVMVGFPGETDEEFEESRNTVKTVGFSHIHVFPYSRRKGTVADRMENQVDENIKNIRTEKMIETGAQIKKEFFEKYMGKTMPILVERQASEGVYEGHTTNFIQVFAKGESREGCVVNVKLTGYENEFMTGDIV
ncbi:MAG: tRNA (N(6)-L-threonylcarbamoyladenosine(37)-C(2))-methylthiotransferase MtaB [Clostridia bacterium]|nr:tRNA (N(6)-L-threonylcarbamoyladenosine(37)-C(2))-methylthiotransferase MtaB [Clostridia bacterium]